MEENLIQKIKGLESLVILDSLSIVGLGIILILYYYKMSKAITELQEKHNKLVDSVLKVEEKCNEYIDETIKLLIELNRRLNK